MTPPRLARAADPQTPPHELRELAARGARDVRAAVARNPNASVALLLSLAAEFPDEVAANAAFALLAVADPAFYRAMSWLDVAVLCGSPAAPPGLLEAALEHATTEANGRVAKALVRNRSLPPRIVESLAFGSPVARGEATRHPNMPPEVRDLLGRFHFEFGVARLAPHARPPTPAELERLLSSGPFGRQLAAAAPEASREFFERLALDPDPRVTMTLARNVNAPADVREALANSAGPGPHEVAGRAPRRTRPPGAEGA